MKKILFIIGISIYQFSYSQSIGGKCPVCPPSLNGVPNGYVLTNSGGHAIWDGFGGFDTTAVSIDSLKRLFTWEQTLTNQSSTPFVFDHYIDGGGRNFNLNNFGSLYTNSPYTGWWSNQANYNYTYWGDSQFQFLSDNNGAGLIINTDNGNSYSSFPHSDIWVDQLHKVIYNGSDANWSHFLTNSTGGSIVNDYGLVSQAGNGAGQGFVWRDNAGGVKMEINNNTNQTVFNTNVNIGAFGIPYTLGVNGSFIQSYIDSNVQTVNINPYYDDGNVGTEGTVTSRNYLQEGAYYRCKSDTVSGRAMVELSVVTHDTIFQPPLYYYLQDDSGFTFRSRGNIIVEIDSNYLTYYKDPGVGKVLTSDASGNATWQGLGGADGSNIPSYPDNATAVAILGAGKLYYTNVAGEYIVKITH